MGLSGTLDLAYSGNKIFWWEESQPPIWKGLNRFLSFVLSIWKAEREPARFDCCVGWMNSNIVLDRSIVDPHVHWPLILLIITLLL